jgi:hypothetical protein
MTGAGNGATAGQLRAVYAAMRILAEDDRQRGKAAGVIVCDACRRDRSAAGSIVYGEVCLCNGCATDYEVLRISRQVESLAAYLADR